MATVENAHSRSLFPDEDYWIENVTDSDEDYPEEKRRRIEKLARAYEAGGSLYIATARLRGPFGPNWKSPWQNRKRFRRNTDHTRNESLTRRKATSVQSQPTKLKETLPSQRSKTVTTPIKRKQKFKKLRFGGSEIFAIPATSDDLGSSPAVQRLQPQIEARLEDIEPEVSPARSVTDDNNGLQGFQALVSQVAFFSKTVSSDESEEELPQKPKDKPRILVMEEMQDAGSPSGFRKRPFRKRIGDILQVTDDGAVADMLEAPKLDMDTSPSSAGQGSAHGSLSPGGDFHLPLILLPESDDIKSRSVSSSFVAEEDSLSGWLDEASGFLQEWTVDSEMGTVLEG